MVFLLRPFTYALGMFLLCYFHFAVQQFRGSDAKLSARLVVKHECTINAHLHLCGDHTKEEAGVLFGVCEDG